MNVKVVMLLVSCIILQAPEVNAQLLSLSIKPSSGISPVAVDETNWSSMQSGYNTTNNTIAFSKGTLSVLGTGVLPKVKLKAQQNNFNYTPAVDYPALTNTVPASVVTAEIATIGGSDALTDLLSSILSNSHPVVLNNTEQSMFDGVANVSLKLTVFSSDRPITIKYTISQSGMQQFLKAAGTYTLGLLFNSYNGLNMVNGSVEATITINVAPFSIINDVPNLPRLKFTEAADYAAGPKAVPAEQAIALTSTVPYQLNIKAGNTRFKDADGRSQNGMLVSHLSAQAGTKGGHAATVSAIPAVETALLSGSSALQQVESIKYGMDAKFTSAYQKLGTYSSSLLFTISNKSGTSANTPKDIYIDVDPISHLSINGSVNLRFLTADDYRNGIHTDVNDHLLVDKNSPFDIYVKADGAYLEGNEGTIQLNNLLKIEPIATGADLPGSLHQVNLTPNYQPLITGSDAAINKKISMRYSIDATSSKRLLNKPVGAYSATVTYSFTAQ